MQDRCLQANIDNIYAKLRNGQWKGATNMKMVTQRANTSGYRMTIKHATGHIITNSLWPNLLHCPGAINLWISFCA